MAGDSSNQRTLMSIFRALIKSAEVLGKSTLGHGGRLRHVTEVKNNGMIVKTAPVHFSPSLSAGSGSILGKCCSRCPFKDVAPKAETRYHLWYLVKCHSY